MAVLVAQHGHLESAYRELCLPILLLGTVLLPWRSAVPPTAWNESLHSTLSPHMHVREGFNLRLPFRDSRKYGLIDPMPMDASATALISGSKGHPLSADIFRRVPNKLLVQLFFYHPSPLPTGQCLHVQQAPNARGPWSASVPLYSLGQNNSPATPVSIPTK
jgi:hypothetical protein